MHSSNVHIYDIFYMKLYIYNSSYGTVLVKPLLVTFTLSIDMGEAMLKGIKHLCYIYVLPISLSTPFIPTAHIFS